MPNLKVLSKIFFKLLHAETNLCGDAGGIHMLVSTIIRYNYNDLPETDTKCNQGIHIPILVIDDSPIYSIPSKTSFM